MNKYICIIIIGLFFSRLLIAEPDYGSISKISLINLIENPSKYKNKVIEVCGYYQHIEGFEGGNYLYLTKDHAYINDRSNAVVLPNAVKNPNGGGPSPERYIRVVGLVDDYDSKLNYGREIYIKEIYIVVGYATVEESKTKAESDRIKSNVGSK